ncbi:MAG: FAD-binding oxidoreductase [Candidatus Harrisonbacteria bacterium CG10_big_fil_rev_8_21_14_0_10_49_15]|uniref:FAD-binding oxidoreductase n=1 Tax=Candidatus Harrisonbacteria bacterium CG10_big_fil_rev_8_21_14_0_10_49_15 TaxID=1974587 RepID=A0A2H0UKX9_9BACT|nr:MAG: FAD-binding oxidoreductase [Candidatus Harrisonbacteria bacterium CG10_big_fil_rev_8_21_14_0_10_49_15]
MLKEDLQKIIKGEVKDDPETLKKYSRDASIFDIKPKAVVFPRDSADIGELVRYVSEHKEAERDLSLTVRSGGTDMSGGPLSESLVLDVTAHLNKIHEVTNEYAIMEPGVYYRDLDKETRQRDVFMPAYPASRDIATVGGMTANNSGGEKTPAYGKVEKFVEELSVVLSDGNEYVIKPLTKAELDAKMKLESFEGKLYRDLYKLLTENADLIKKAKPNVSKNSAGYYLWNVVGANFGAGDPAKGGIDDKFDLTQLIVGSQGTLGIITKVKFRLVRVKPVSKMAVMFLHKLDHLGEAILDVSKLEPESLESYDDKTLRLAIRFFMDIVRILKPKNVLVLAWKVLPEILHIIFGGMPKLVVMAEFTGENEAEVDAKLAQVVEHMKKFKVRVHITTSQEEANEYWTIRRESFGLLRAKVTSKLAAPFIDDFCVRPEVLPEFLPKLTVILERAKIRYAIQGHPGDGNFHIFPLLDVKDPAQRALIPKLSDEVYSLVLEYKGSITAEHNDGLIRTPYLEKMYGPDVIRLFEKTKLIFDPKNIFNPGKKVWGNLAYAMAHIKRG